ncbi:putative nicotinate-nucleotide adenylyltransferase [Clarias magur]|uniref:Putative nicotinate-nucleotide adenylyltransferase n=1 Tax=Clarias magur TaxID=1594786 RepID=A0A8J4TCL6_CLAMG|nr:putative nicotinate-nucleotide adenylyltransferase [Clarias magur]
MNGCAPCLCLSQIKTVSCGGYRIEEEELENEKQGGSAYLSDSCRVFPGGEGGMWCI